MRRARSLTLLQSPDSLLPGQHVFVGGLWPQVS